MTEQPHIIERYVHADGAVVLVPARVAAWLDRAANLNELRIRSRGNDPEVDAVLGALRLSALTWRGSVCGTTQDTAPEPEQPSPQWLTTKEAAHIARIGERGIRKAIAAGRLHAVHAAGRWWINPEDAAQLPCRTHRLNQGEP